MLSLLLHVLALWWYTARNCHEMFTGVATLAATAGVSERLMFLLAGQKLGYFDVKYHSFSFVVETEGSRMV